MNNETFYLECARLLNCSHEGEPFPYPYRTRWNNRGPGQGRFPGRGTIRAFADDLVHVALHDPVLVMTGTKVEVLAALAPK